MTSRNRATMARSRSPGSIVSRVGNQYREDGSGKYVSSNCGGNAQDSIFISSTSRSLGLATRRRCEGQAPTRSGTMEGESDERCPQQNLHEANFVAVPRAM